MKKSQLRVLLSMTQYMAKIENILHDRILRVYIMCRES